MEFELEKSTEKKTTEICGGLTALKIQKRNQKVKFRKFEQGEALRNDQNTGISF